MNVILVLLKPKTPQDERVKDALIKSGNTVAVINLAENMTHEDAREEEIYVFLNDPYDIIAQKENNLIKIINEIGSRYMYFNNSLVRGQTLLPNLGGNMAKLEAYL